MLIIPYGRVCTLANIESTHVAARAIGAETTVAFTGGPQGTCSKRQTLARISSGPALR